MKTYTVCGSMRYAKEMIKISQTLDPTTGYFQAKYIYHTTRDKAFL